MHSKLFGIVLLFIGLLLSYNAKSQDKYKVAAVGFYNLENLFDTLDTPDKIDEEFLPNGIKLYTSKVYQEKIKNLSTVISHLGTNITPDGVAILGVAEVENRSVLEDLVHQEALQARNYQIVHFESPDARGVDVGLVYQPKYFELLNSKAIELPIYKDDSVKTPTRDILYVQGLLDGDTISIMVNHWPSRRGGEAATEPLRMRGAQICRDIKDSLLRKNPSAKVIIMGDLNDDPASRSLTVSLSAKGDQKKVKPNDMFNPMYDFYNKGIGTTAYRDAWSLFDQLVVSPTLINNQTKGYHFYKAFVYNDRSIQQLTGKFKGYPLRTYSGDQYIHGYSDHFPVYMLLVQKL